MKTVDIVFEIQSYWHVGTGLGRGADVDSVVMRDPVGLPYLPGKTVKGLLREGAMIAEENRQVPAGTVERLFGTVSMEGDPSGTTAGCLVISDALMIDEERKWLEANGAFKPALFNVITSTAIDERGMALDHTLRSIEVTVPVTLRARVSGPAGHAARDWESVLKIAVRLVRGLGGHRNRGLGRCKVTMNERMGAA